MACLPDNEVRDEESEGIGPGNGNSHHNNTLFSTGCNDDCVSQGEEFEMIYRRCLGIRRGVGSIAIIEIASNRTSASERVGS